MFPKEKKKTNIKVDKLVVEKFPATIALGMRRHAFYTISYSGAEVRNPTIRVEVKCSVLVYI